MTHCTHLISKIKNILFKTESLYIKLLKPLDKYNLKSVIQYYASFSITADFCLIGTTEKKVLKIMQDIKSSRTAGVDKLLGKFLKDGNVSIS